MLMFAWLTFNTFWAGANPRHLTTVMKTRSNRKSISDTAPSIGIPLHKAFLM
jgi:hypothetical protein